MEMEEFTELSIHFGFHSMVNFEEGMEDERPNCYGSGKYCAIPGKLGINDGRVILNEILFQKCIHKYSYGNKETELYWEYMSNFYTECILKETFTSTCSMAVMDKVDIDIDEIGKCVEKSFDSKSARGVNKEAVVKNFILDEEYNLRHLNYITSIPTLFINGRIFTGTLSADNIFEAICAGLSTKPDICLYEPEHDKKHKTSSIAIIISILAIIVINIGIFWVCSKFIKSRILQRLNNSNIESRVDNVVNTYLKIREGGNNTSSS